MAASLPPGALHVSATAPQPPPRTTRATTAAAAAASAASEDAARTVEALAAQTFPSLPADLVAHIFRMLPSHTLLRCMEVSRGWRAFLREPALWTCVELAHSAVQSVSLLRAACARAAGRLESLNIEGWRLLSCDALLSVVRANRATLRELRTWCCSVADEGYEDGRFLSPQHVAALLEAAPHLTLLESDVSGCLPADSLRLLATPCFRPRELRTTSWDSDASDAVQSDIPAFAAAAASKETLSILGMLFAPLDEEPSMTALVDMAVSLNLESLTLTLCTLDSDVLCDGLASLLARGQLSSLSIDGYEGVAADDLFSSVTPPFTRFCAELAASPSLTSLSLSGLNIWHDPEVSNALMKACRRCSLEVLVLSGNDSPPERRLEVGSALARLMRKSDSLQVLDVSGCGLGDVGGQPIFDSLAVSNLCSLTFRNDAFSAAFARDTILPAVRAADFLFELDLGLEKEGPVPPHPELLEAEAIVKERE